MQREKPMMLWLKLSAFGLALLVVMMLPACQSRSEASYSETTRDVAGEIEREVTARMCEALRPEQVTPEDFDASPVQIRDALVRNASAWVAVCPAS